MTVPSILFTNTIFISEFHYIFVILIVPYAVFTYILKASKCILNLSHAFFLLFVTCVSDVRIKSKCKNKVEIKFFLKVADTIKYKFGGEQINWTHLWISFVWRYMHWIQSEYHTVRLSYGRLIHCSSRIVWSPNEEQILIHCM